MLLHDEIMNIKSEPYRHASVSWKDGYNYGHRSARHAAAELAIKADADVKRLINIAQQVHDRILRGDSDQELLALLDQANTPIPEQK